MLAFLFLEAPLFSLKVFAQCLGFGLLPNQTFFQQVVLLLELLDYLVFDLRMLVSIDTLLTGRQLLH